jgi:hypothetical protein
MESLSIIAPNAAGKEKKVGAGETAATHPKNGTIQGSCGPLFPKL